ncbi:T9SS type A sorting domain-containing protein, partial [Cytophaga aurantiaca]
VAPNPFVDETRIDFHYKKNAGSAMLKVMNMQGEIVYESTEFDINETISIGKELKSGIYIVVVIYENESYVRTIVKNQ